MKRLARLAILCVPLVALGHLLRLTFRRHDADGRRDHSLGGQRPGLWGHRRKPGASVWKRRPAPTDELPIQTQRLLTLGPDNEPLWIRLYVHPGDKGWTAMICGDDVPPLAPGESMGAVFFGATAEEAERLAKAYLGLSEPSN